MMLPEKKQILIDYLDNVLEGDERLQAEQLLRDEPEAAAELEDLRFSADLIREAAITEQVMAARKAFSSAAPVITMQPKQGAVVRSFSKNALRAAAVLIVLLGSASVLKYSTTNSSSVYDNNFTSFELSASRGNNDDGALEKAYRTKNWTAVESIAAAAKEKTGKTWFLAGMAELELKKYDNAIVYFNKVTALNENNPSPYFEDEAEYYLAMANLGAGNNADAVTILKKIRADKQHLFYKKAAGISALDLKVLEMKK